MLGGRRWFMEEVAAGAFQAELLSAGFCFRTFFSGGESLSSSSGLEFLSVFEHDRLFRFWTLVCRSGFRTLAMFRSSIPVSLR